MTQPTDVLDLIRARYAEDLPATKWQAAWASESTKVSSALSYINSRLNGMSMVSAIGVGGSGITVLLENPNHADDRAVLKFPRPAEGIAARLNRNVQKEFRSLRELRHQNVIRVLNTCDGGADITQPAFYVMEYLSGVEDADKYYPKVIDLDQSRSDATLLDLVTQLIAAVSYIHSRGIVHLDIKPGNIFVDEVGLVVLADFGFAKHIDEPGLTSNPGGTKEYMHPDYFHLMTMDDEAARQMAEQITRTVISRKWDLYSTGATIFQLLAIADKCDPKRYSSYSRRYLRILAARLLDGQMPHARAMGIPVPTKILGLSEEALAKLSYSSASEVAEDIDKVRGRLDVTVMVPETNRYIEHMVQAASHSRVPFSPRIQSILDSREVRRLSHLNQLGLVSYVYPTATHSRLEHTLGTFAMACRYIRGLANDSINPIFRQIMTRRDIDMLLVAALIHDIGHYPLAHDLEEAEVQVFSHELRTIALLRRPDSNLRRVLLGADWDVDVDRLSRVLSHEAEASDIRDEILRAVLDGPLDADKVDYLIRDSEDLRLPYGRGIDYERLVQSITVTVETVLTRPRASIGIHESGRIAAESIAFARYALYGTVYWHRTHRAAKAMLQRVAYEAMFVAKEGDAKQKEGWMKELRNDLYAFLDSGIEEQRLPLVERAPLSQGVVDVDTARMLRWLDEKGVGRAHNLVEGLLERRLFKRVLVVSRGYPSVINWDRVISLFGEVGRRWDDRLRASVLLQTALVERVAAFSRENRTVSTVTPTVADSFVVRSKHEPLVLIDYPPNKPGSGEELRVLRENEGVRPGDDEFTVNLPEASALWSQLRQQSPLYLAKVRVFAHPDYRDLLRVALARDDFERLVMDAIAEAVR